MCESCQNCSDEKCVRFFSIWNIVWGIAGFLMCVGTIIEMRMDKKEDLLAEVYTYILMGTAPVYTVSGILIYFGDQKDRPGLFSFGLIISNIFPILACGTIFLPIVHFIALTRLCQYQRQRWN